MLDFRVLHVLLLRHGQTDSNAGGVLQGHLPTPLNALGHEQAARLAARLATYDPPIDALVTSDLRRAAETCAPVALALGLTADSSELWRERSFGPLEGRVVEETEVWRASNGTLDPPGAEPLDRLRHRVRTALLTLARDYRARRCVAVVTHGGVMRTALQLLQDGDLPLASGQTPPEVAPIRNASILHLAVAADDRWRVVRVNDADHLDTLLPA